LRKADPRKSASNVIQLTLVVVAITVTIIVALYVTQRMLGRVQEEPPSVKGLEFVNLTTSRDANMNWQILVYIANPGNSTVTLERALVNTMEASEYSAESPAEIVGTITTDLVKETDLESGGVKGVTVWIGGQFGYFNSGSVLDIKFESLAGTEFVKTVILP
jgi:hypothetical protein